jgi:hypothetical protein
MTRKPHSLHARLAAIFAIAGMGTATAAITATSLESPDEAQALESTNPAAGGYGDFCLDHGPGRATHVPANAETSVAYCASGPLSQNRRV